MSFDAAFERLALYLHWLGAVVVLAIAGLSVYDTALRNIANVPLLGTPELVANGLVVLVFCQTPWVILNQKLLRVTILTHALPARLQVHFEAAAYLIGAAFFLAIAWFAFGPAMHSWERGEFFGSVMFRIPAWPIRFGTLVLWLVSAAACFVVIARLYQVQTESGAEADQAEDIV